MAIVTIFACSVDVKPCPPDAQTEITAPTLEDFAAIGVTPESMASAIGYGFGFVLVLALIPMIAGWIIKMIKSI